MLVLTVMAEPPMVTAPVPGRKLILFTVKGAESEFDKFVATGAVVLKATLLVEPGTVPAPPLPMVVFQLPAVFQSALEAPDQ